MCLTTSSSGLAGSTVIQACSTLDSQLSFSDGVVGYGPAVSLLTLSVLFNY